MNSTALNVAGPAEPDFRSCDSLLDHVRHTLAFYARTASDDSGGFFHFFEDDGTVYDRTTRHLVSSTRFVFNHAMAFRHFGGQQHQDNVRHAFAFLRNAHWDAVNEGYDWEIEWRDGAKRTLDGTWHCYGHVFVLLAYAHATMAGIDEAKPLIDETFQLMDKHFWDAGAGLYADEATPDWQLSPYRGQNANMHATEALLAAYEATGHVLYLDRAEKIAGNNVASGAVEPRPGLGALPRRLVGRLALQRIRQFQHLPPVGFPARASDRMGEAADPGAVSGVAVARAASDRTIRRRRAWDEQHGGLYYDFGPDNSICDHDKYFWVQAETFATAALLGKRIGLERFWDCYDELWRYSWAHFVDHGRSRIRCVVPHPDLRQPQVRRRKEPAGKTDYHTMGACYEVLNAINAADTPRQSRDATKKTS